jgi:hypothetical protein
VVKRRCVGGAVRGLGDAPNVVFVFWIAPVRHDDSVARVGLSSNVGHAVRDHDSTGNPRAPVHCRAAASSAKCNAQRVHNTISSVSEREKEEEPWGKHICARNQTARAARSVQLAMQTHASPSMLASCAMQGGLVMGWTGGGVRSHFFFTSQRMCVWPPVENSVRASGRMWVDGGGLATRDKRHSVPAFCAPHASADLHVAYRPCPPPSKDTLPSPRWLHRVSSRRACFFTACVCWLTPLTHPIETHQNTHKFGQTLAAQRRCVEHD